MRNLFRPSQRFAAFFLACVTLSAMPARTVAQQTSSEWTLTNHQYSETYVNQPFAGNGYIGLRIPSAGEGYWAGSKPPDESSSWPLGTPRYASTLVAGWYGEKGAIAALPSATSLTVRDAGRAFDPLTVAAGQIADYQQTTDMLRGIVTTSLVWTSPAGNRARLVWHIYAHRKYVHLAVVRLDVTPLAWRGPLDVDAFLDLRGVRRANELSEQRHEDLHAGTGEVLLASSALHTRAAMAFGAAAPRGADVSALNEDARFGFSWRLTPAANKTYTFVKYVGIATAVDADAPGKSDSEAVKQRARDAVQLAMRQTGGAIAAYDKLLALHEAAWREIWQSDAIVDTEHADLQAVIHAAEYMLLSNVREGARSSIAPAGLTSDNYAGKIFWDAETWMYPWLLAAHPEMAKSIVDYRYDTLPNALRNTQTDAKEIHANAGAWFPWTSATGIYSIDDGDSAQIHLQADIALAQFQYFMATGDKDWLRTNGWPVLKANADYYAARATRNSDGSYSIVGVDGPDEYTNNATDAAYTNGSALRAFDFATAAAKILGYAAPQRWADVREHLVKPQTDAARGIHLQYKGFDPAHPRTLKQADVVLLAYPMEYPMTKAAEAKDLEFYSAITDPLGPSMTNSVQAIIAADAGAHTLGRFFVDSYKPYVRGPYRNFNETAVLVPSAGQWNPAYTFLTGEGGFLQTLVNGFGGFRVRQDVIYLAPTLPADAIDGKPLQRVLLKGLHWQGRVFDVDITPARTTVVLTHGPQAAVQTPRGSFVLRPGVRLTLPTAIL